MHCWKAVNTCRQHGGRAPCCRDTGGRPHTSGTPAPAVLLLPGQCLPRQQQQQQLFPISLSYSKVALYVLCDQLVLKSCFLQSAATRVLLLPGQS